MPLPTRAYADALHSVFSFEARQSSTLADPWPLQAEGGWHRVMAGDGLPALWAGNDTTGLYDNNATNITRSRTDFAVDWLDLRFATSARSEFSYSGETAPAGPSGAGDRLRFEVATEPGYANWTPLRVGNGTDMEDTGGRWTNVSVDLSAYVGQRVRLRFNFTSDETGTASGFFLRNFTVSAPSTFDGTLVQADTHYVVGFLSFTDLSVGPGSVHLVRTPGGEILFYGAAWQTSAPPSDQVRYQSFSPLENPQILFAVMLASAYAVSRSQEAAYLRYRNLHPAAYRSAVPKARKLHALGKVTIAVLVLLYFLPTAFHIVGIPFFVSGLTYWFLALVLALSVGLGTRTYYGSKLQEEPTLISPETGRASGERALISGVETPAEVPCAHCLREIPGSDRTYRCGCGAEYHLTCAAELEKCPNCRKPVSVEVVRKIRFLSIRCATCGQVERVSDETDLRAVICGKCGGHLRALEPGKGYLVVASNPAVTFGWLRDLTKGGKPALCLTTAAPERLRLEYGLRGVDFVHVSSTARRAIRPKRLDPDALKSILALLRAEQGGVLLFDGLEHIVNESSVGDIVRFLRKVNDMAFVHAVTVLARVSPGALHDSEIERLAAELDESIDLRASP